LTNSVALPLEFITGESMKLMRKNQHTKMFHESNPKNNIKMQTKSLIILLNYHLY